MIADRIGQYATARRPTCWGTRANCSLFTCMSIAPILSSASAPKWLVIIVSKTLALEGERNWGEPIDIVEFGRKLAARRAELGDPQGTRNSGARRTASKRALLEEIGKVAAAKGITW